jgi:hypothetical protein
MGVQGIVMSDTPTPPPACFGPDTLVLCGDGVRRRISDLPQQEDVHVVAVHPDGDTVQVVPVQVVTSKHLNTTEKVCQLAPGMWVTGAHTFAVERDVQPTSTPAAIHFGSRFKDCARLAQAMPRFHTDRGSIPLNLYHLRPVRFDAHKNFGVIVGQEDAPVCVAEFYRTPTGTF